MVNISKKRAKWKRYKDFFQKKKKIGKHRVYLFGGKERGAEIIILMRGKDKETHFDEQINFMNWENAVEEYNNLKSSKDLLNLIRRNQ